MQNRVLLVIALAAFLLSASSVSADHVGDDEITWACGFGGGGQTGHPDSCGIDPLGGDGVQSVQDPEFGEPWLPADAPVLGVAHNGIARAYPLTMLDRHEIINDRFGADAVAVTYCPLCGSGLAFQRTLVTGEEAITLDLAPSGFLFRHDLVMWDAQTGTLWNQILGEAVATLREDRVEADHPAWRLATLPSSITTWETWHTAHPGATMLQPADSVRYGGAYVGYADSCRIGISSASDCDIDGLHPKEQVIGAATPFGAVAFPIEALARDGGAAVHAATSVVAAIDTDGLPVLYDAGRHRFQADGDLWRDQSGAQWDLRAGERTDDGLRLATLDAATMYWFAWRDHHPDTALWLPEDHPPARDQPAPALGLAVVVGAVGVAAARFRQHARQRCHWGR